MKKYIPVLFWIVLLAQLLFIQQEMATPRLVSKLLLVPLLVVMLTLNGVSLKQYWRAYVGLFFSWIGDGMLIFPGAAFFLAGMIAFILAHVHYSLYFIQLHTARLRWKGNFLLFFLGLLLLCLLLFNWLKPYLGVYQLPILLYMAFICLMASLAAHTAEKDGYRALVWRSFIPGALLFVSSDALLAVNKFYGLPLWADIGVMLTYGMAQYFLTIGFVRVALMQSGSTK